MIDLTIQNFNAEYGGFSKVHYGKFKNIIYKFIGSYKTNSVAIKE